MLAFAPFHRNALGGATGVVLGGLIFLMTLTLVIKGGYPLGPKLGLLRHFFPGYTVSFAGAWVGLAWGFSAGFLLGWGVAFIHNFTIWLWLTVVKSRAELEQYGDFLDHM